MDLGSLSLGGNIFLAPLAGITSAPLRLLCRRAGAAFTYTEMVSADGLVRGRGESRLLTHRLLQTLPGERPVGVQIFGRDPEILAEAARLVSALDADLVDLNFGCPEKKIVRNGSGVALMKDPQKAEAIFRAVRRATTLPLTVKIRSGFDQHSINAPEIARIAEAQGLDAVAVHARTGKQAFHGEADWSVIRRVAEAVSLPVIGNGDVTGPESCRRLQAETGCRAVMIGRAARGNPWVFRAIVHGGPPPTLAERREAVLLHLQWLEELYGPEKAGRDIRLHLAWYCKGLPSAAAIRRRLNSLRTIAEVRKLVDEALVAGEEGLPPAPTGQDSIPQSGTPLPK